MHIREFQEMMKKIYFQRDSKRGTKGIIDWLVDEVEELREAIEIGNRKEIEKEFADVIAWLASLANVIGIDLEDATLEKYPSKCPKCLHAPCKCTF
jgi:NTP pyrophosphatase (non-canonical NTP hydrolase)